METKPRAASSVWKYVMNGEFIPWPAPWARIMAAPLVQGFGSRTSNGLGLICERSGALQPITPQRTALGVEAARLEDAFNGGIAGMDFGADASNAPLSGIIKERRDQSASDAFASPLAGNKE